MDEQAVRRIPRTDIVCVNPLGTGNVDVEERTRGAERVFEIDTGHDLMITEPEKVSEFLLQLT